MAQPDVPSVAFTVDDVARVVRMRVVRNPSDEELTEVIAAIGRDPAYQTTFGFLADCSAVSIAPTSDYVRRFVGFMSAHRAVLADVRWAQVVAPGVSFGMARMGGLLSGRDSGEYKAFTDIDDAERWLASDPQRS